MAEFYQAHKELIPTLLQLRKTEEEKKRKIEKEKLLQNTCVKPVVP